MVNERQRWLLCLSSLAVHYGEEVWACHLCQNVFPTCRIPDRNSFVRTDRRAIRKARYLLSQHHNEEDKGQCSHQNWKTEFWLTLRTSLILRAEKCSCRKCGPFEYSACCPQTTPVPEIMPVIAVTVYCYFLYSTLPQLKVNIPLQRRGSV